MEEEYEYFLKEQTCLQAEKEHQEWYEYQEELKKSQKEAKIEVTKIPDKVYEERIL